MHISDAGLALIKRFEGFSATPYVCPGGYLTIGYGHIRTAESFARISKEEGEQLLREDVRDAEGAVRRLIRAPLRQAQFDALVSFTFNLGAGALQRSSLRQVINRSQHHEVPKQLRRWVFAGGRKLPGLLRRREAEVVLYMQVS